MTIEYTKYETSFLEFGKFHAVKLILDDLRQAYDVLWEEMETNEDEDHAIMRFNMAKTIAEIRANITLAYAI